MNDISIYDEVSFPSYPHALTHPQRLATIAKFRGLDSPPIDHCRVLELGCGSGGNLIPLADTLANSEFVGVDLSAQQIDIAKQHIAASGLTNIQFITANILDLNNANGPFDYVLCHGVYSWTTDEGRAKVLGLCRELLAPAGVAYINYNTFPGWHIQGMLRDMLRFHCERFTDPQRRVREARGMIQFLITELQSHSASASTMLRKELTELQRYSDSYIFHAYLNVVNRPFYLHEMIERAAEYELQYLGDAEPQAMWPEAMSAQTADRIRDLAGRSEPMNLPAVNAGANEQYYDFVRFSMSRRSLFCRSSISLRSLPVAEVLEGLHVSGHVQIAPASVEPSLGTDTIITSKGHTFAIRDPKLSLLFRLLHEAWPESRSWQWLREELENRIPTASSSGSSSLDLWLEDIFRFFIADIVDLAVRANPSVRSLSARPRTTAFARRQAATQNFVTNLRHTAVSLNDFDRLVLQQLDGTRTELEIAASIHAIPVEPTAIHQSLLRLAAQALLIA